jgi:hypothetical protein
MHRASSAAAHHPHTIGSEGNRLRVGTPRTHGRVVVVRPRLGHDGIGRGWLRVLLPGRATRNSVAYTLFTSRRMIAITPQCRARQIRGSRAASSRCRRRTYLGACRSRHAIVIGPRLRPGLWNTAQCNGSHHKADSGQVSHASGPIFPASRPASARTVRDPLLNRERRNYRIFPSTRNQAVLPNPFFCGPPTTTPDLEAS